MGNRVQRKTKDVLHFLGDILMSPNDAEVKNRVTQAAMYPMTNTKLSSGWARLYLLSSSGIGAYYIIMTMYYFSSIISIEQKKI